MITPRPAAERGRTHIDWLDSWHSFSFGEYHDPDHMGHGDLRVINDDVVAPGMGFGEHPHRDMEILTWVLEGALEHRDSTGGHGIIRPGDAQIMSAGTGIRHSEFNPSRTEPVRLLQIWVMPNARGLKPRYDQKAIPESERRGRLRAIASPEGNDGSLIIHQDMRISNAVLAKGQEVTTEIAPRRNGYVQVARGAVSINGQRYGQGDAAVIVGPETLRIAATDGEAEVMVFDGRE